jgi:hypothetical protein
MSGRRGPDTARGGKGGRSAMGWKRFLTVVVSVCVMPGLGTIALAADSDAGKKKSRFALYLEAAGGTAEANNLNSSIETTSNDTSSALLSLDENYFGRAVIGWQLTPKERGRFLLRFEGYRETSYVFDAQGLQSTDSTGNWEGGPLPWWTVHAEAGQTTSKRTTPTFEDDELVFDQDLTIIGPAPDDLQNRLHSYDLIFERRFGGRKTRALWTAGLRYYNYDGNVPAGAWLNLIGAGVGYTDGGILRLMTMRQTASGVGPVFSIELQHGFLRDRLVIFGEARTAFVLQSLSVDSGDFFALVREGSSGAYVTTPARLEETTSKSSWQPGLEIGLSVKLVEDLNLYFSYLISSYQDVVILPYNITIPDNPNQTFQGVSAVYNTHDLQYDGGLFGFSFQW